MQNERMISVGVIVGPLPEGSRASAGHLPSGNKQNNIDYIPFLLAALEALITTENRSDYIQADGLHPTAKAQPMLLEHLWPSIQSNLKP